MNLNLFDFGLIAVYLIGVTLFGLQFRDGEKSLKSYYLAGNSIPWWAISLSIVAAETSTLTVISVPGLAYEQNFCFLQLVMGYIIGRILVSFLFLPHYFTGDLMTAYQLMERRFGQRLRTLTACIFLLTRAAAEGVRVFAVAIVVRIALSGWMSGLSDLQRDVAAIAIVTLLTLIYTFEGGMKAAIWTDVLQQTVYVSGTLIGLFTLLHLVPGGWPTIHAMGSAAGKFQVLDLHFNLTTKYTLWAGIIGGAFLTTASHGTDQLIVQRLLSAKTQAQSKLALITSGVAILFQFSLFLLIGAMLYVYYRQQTPPTVFSRTDTVFPSFVVAHMPHGISGLLVAAILAAAMSNLAAALNALSSTTIVDLYARLRPLSSDATRLRLSRAAMVFWAFILFALAIVARNGGRVLEVGLSISSVAYGCLLGVFLLGVLTKRADERGAMVGMLMGLLMNLYLWQCTHVAFTWYVVFGSLTTFAVGYSFSRIFPQARPIATPDVATPTSIAAPTSVEGSAN